MKKILLSASLLFAGMMASYAQVPDASQWEAGQEITEAVGFGNTRFENDPFDFWHLVKSTGDVTNKGEGLFEIYNGSEVDLYQYVQLPAGMYRVECQGYYRNGESWAYDPNSYANKFFNGTGAEEWADNALLYVQNGAYDITSEEFTPARTFKTPLMPRLFPEQMEQLYVMDKDAYEPDHWDMSDGQYNQCGGRWAPTSIPGTQVWFSAGFYLPYVDDDYENTKIKYNTTSFFVAEPGYVKIGVSKVDPRGADSFIVTDFKLYYDGEVDPETAELLALQEEVREYYDKVKKIESKYSEGMIYSLINDAISEFEDEYGTPDDLESEDDCAAAKLALISLINEIEAAEVAFTNLSSVLPKMELLYKTTDYAGKAEFEQYLTAAQNCLDPNYEMGPDDNFNTFKTAYDNIIAARVTYLMTQQKVNGAYNFSSAIDMPFFCQNEYTPVWNEAADAYQFPTVEGVEDALQPENTWATIQEQGYSEAKGAEGRESWLPISDGVLPLSEKAAENRWCIKSTTWHGETLDVTMQHSYPAIGGWRAECTGDNPELVYQTLTGLPNGYYSMSALLCNAGAEPSPLQYVYIETTDGTTEKALLTKKGSPWWGGNPTDWRKGVWEKLSTAMVYVGDGKVTIGTSSDGFYATTGFQLYYYGETPDFASLLQPVIDKAKKNIEDNLIWKGDIAKANALLAQVNIDQITDDAAYQAAQAAIKAANEYVATASAVVKNFKGAENFAALAEKYEEGTPEADILGFAWITTMSIGEGENDTYELAVQNDKDYAAYVHYFDFRSAMGDLASDNNVAAVLSTQNEYLIDNFANAEKIAEFEQALALPYNKALLASLGASGATEKNPIDITALLINPKFDEGNKGWTGNPTVTSGEALPEELGAAEMWNVNFDVNQIIYALPEGFYKVECQALYRDAGDAKDAYTNWVYKAIESFEDWENKNAKLYANDNDTTIVSIASELFTERSMTAYQNKSVKLEEAGSDGEEIWAPAWRIMCTEKDGDNFVLPTELPADAPKDLAPEQYIVSGVTDWWWDTEIDDMDEFYYYPASLMGATRRFKNSPNAYKNEVVTKVEEGGSLQLGIKKEVQVTNDWVVFDNFKLYYLGKEAPTGINEAAAEKAAVEGIFSVSGVQQNALQKGFNIVKKANGDVKKIFKD